MYDERKRMYDIYTRICPLSSITVDQLCQRYLNKMQYVLRPLLWNVKENDGRAIFLCSLRFYSGK
jgi:hypothetical protein